MSGLARIFAFALGFLFLSPIHCGNKKDRKTPVGEKLAGVKILSRVPGSNDLFFILVTNNYNLHYTGSIQVRSRKDISKVVVVEEVPSFGTTLQTFKAEDGKDYLALTFEPETSKVAPDFLVRSFTVTTGSDGKETFAFGSKKFEYKLERSSSDYSSNKKRKTLIPISSLVHKTTEGLRLAISCNAGELLVMDLSDVDPNKWKAPVHVRSYGKYVKREAMFATKEDILVLMPAFSDVSIKDQFSTGHDKKMKIASGSFAPESEMSQKNALQERTSVYQAGLFDLREKLNFKPYKDVHKKEGFWVSFDMDGESSSSTEAYYRTNFLRAHAVSSDPRTNDTFYVSQRSSLLNVSVKNQIIEVKALANLRAAIDAGAADFDGMAFFEFNKKPVFELKDEESSSFSKDPKIYSLYDFVVTKPASGPSNPARFGAISYNYKKKRYFLLKGSKNVVSTLIQERKTSKAPWGLVYWSDTNKYITVIDSYKKAAKLQSGTF